MCSLCNTHLENPLTLFWECQTTRNFWSQVRTFLADYTFQLRDSRLSFLFGFSREPWDSVANTIVMIGNRSFGIQKLNRDCRRYRYGWHGLGFDSAVSWGTENAQRHQRQLSTVELAGHNTQFKFIFIKINEVIQIQMLTFSPMFVMLI